MSGLLPNQLRSDDAYRTLHAHRDTLTDDHVIDAIDWLMDAATADKRALMESYNRTIRELLALEGDRGWGIGWRDHALYLQRVMREAKGELEVRPQMNEVGRAWALLRDALKVAGDV